MPETATGQEQAYSRPVRVIDKDFDWNRVKKPEVELGLFPSNFPKPPDINSDLSKVVIDFARFSESDREIALGNALAGRYERTINIGISEKNGEWIYDSDVQRIEVIFKKSSNKIKAEINDGIDRAAPLLLEYNGENSIELVKTNWKERQRSMINPKGRYVELQDGQVFLFSRFPEPQYSPVLIVAYRDEPQSKPYNWTFRRIRALSDISPKDIIAWQAYRNESAKREAIDKGAPREVSDSELAETVRELQEKLRAYHNANDEVERLQRENGQKNDEIAKLNARNSQKDSEIEKLKAEIEQLKKQKASQVSSAAERSPVSGLVENLLGNLGYSHSEFRSLTRSSQEAVLKQLERSLRTMNHEGTLKTESQDRKQRQETYMKNALQELDNFAEQYGIILGPGNAK